MDKNSKKRTVRGAAVAALVGGLAIAACGGGGGSGANPALLALGAAPAPAPAPAPTPAPPAEPGLPAVQQTEFERHMEASRLNTGGDPQMAYPWRAFYCNLSDDNNAIVLAERAKNSIRVPLTQLFDDVWYIGTEYVGQYILRDANGIVMIDAGNNAQEMRDYDLPALAQLGLSPTLPLNGVLVTHGHSDHDGGALALKTATGAPIYLGSADAINKAYDPVKLDSMVQDPYDIVVGGRTITVLSTPGHTAGTTGYVVRAKDGGKDVKLFVSGGSSLVTDNVALIQAYLHSMERTYALIKTLKVDTASNPHIYWDGSRSLIYKIREQGLKSPSQFVIGNEKLLRAMAIGYSCTAAWLAKKAPDTAVPVWRVSAIDFIAGSPSPNRIAARLVNGWGPVAGKTVSFATAQGETVCQATTDAHGIARCAVPTPALSTGAEQLVARFEGTSTEQTVDLGSEAQAPFEDLQTSLCRDLAQARQASGSRTGDSTYKARLDADGDGVIGLVDVQQITALLPQGSTCP
ncbi:MBL fold metallo-hydrolase [Pseudacidovorax sp. NFM-22]|uniref:MBL fold metallo-hydrolase n=1 Tax=Pseudacidovorax sp. NFM-22 TaxID=2744469 RepID=UPI001F15E9B3|nr:MBL fold metallo-hydrolase [Pseudacidovorax sp. NFM-22]